MEKAMSFASDLGNTQFKGSQGWLQSFVKRNNITFGTMTGERGDVSTTTVEEWKEKLPTICRDYQPKDIFNMDETGLFFKDTTKKSFHFKGDDCSAGKRSKERITVALTASMTGEKLTPVVIGKSSQPRCFKNIKIDKLPVTYRNNRKSWMTTELMINWLRTVDRDMRKAHRKIILFLDNAPMHPMLKISNVKLCFFPPNTTSKLQPMDQCIIQTVKLKYRKKQLQHILTQMEKNDKVGSQLLKEISILDSVFWISNAWKEVDPKTITKCFVNSGFTFPSDPEIIDNQNNDAADDDDDEVPLVVFRMSHELFGCEFKDLINIDNKLSTCDYSEATDWDRTAASDILHELRADDDSDDDNDDENVTDCTNEMNLGKVCSAGDIQDYICSIRNYALHNGNNDLLDSIMAVDQTFSTICTQKQKQTKIEDYFKKK